MVVTVTETDKRSLNIQVVMTLMKRGTRSFHMELMSRRSLHTSHRKPAIIKEMEEIFLTLRFSQSVTVKLMNDQRIDSSQTLAGLSDEDTTTICNVIRRPDGLVSGEYSQRG